MQTKKLNIETFAAKTAAGPMDSTESLIQRLRKDKVYMLLPAWIMNWEVDEGVVPSSRSSLDCYGILMMQYKEAQKVQHPVFAIDTLLTKSDLSFTPVQVKASEKEVYPVKRGFVIEDPAEEVVIISAGYNSNILSYYTRGAEKTLAPGETAKVGSDTISVGIPKEKAESVGIVYADFVDLRIAAENLHKSVGVARDEMYRSFRASPDTSLFCTNAILQKIPKYSIEEKSLTQVMDSILDKLKMERVPFLFPKSNTISVCRAKSPDVAWRFLHMCRGIRGENNSGISIVTIGYYWLETTRSFAKNFSKAVDCMNMLREFKVKTLYLGSGAKLNDYVIRIIVANGYTVVSPLNYTLKGGAEIPGYYSTLPKGCDYAVLVDAIYGVPEVKVKTVEWPEFDLVELLTSQAKEDKIVHYFCFSTLVPCVEGKYSLFPSCMPHNGSVILTAKGLGGFAFDKMIERMSLANSYRNAFPYNRVPFCSVDPMTDWVLPMEVRTLPRTRTLVVKNGVFDLEMVAPLEVEKQDITLTKAQVERFTPKIVFPQVEEDFFGVLKSVNLMTYGVISVMVREHLVKGQENLISRLYKLAGDDPLRLQLIARSHVNKAVKEVEKTFNDDDYGDREQAKDNESVESSSSELEDLGPEMAVKTKGLSEEIMEKIGSVVLNDE